MAQAAGISQNNQNNGGPMNNSGGNSMGGPMENGNSNSDGGNNNGMNWQQQVNIQIYFFIDFILVEM